MLMIKKYTPEFIFILFHSGLAIYVVSSLFHPAGFDFAGHIAAAKLFSQGYFHAYNDNNFLGYIQNLFYPPLQDAIVTLISKFTHNNFIQASTIYITLLYIVYLFSISYLSGLLKNLYIKSVFLILISLALLIDQCHSFAFGLSFSSLFETGLSAQFLGSIFLFILIRNLIEKKIDLFIPILLCFSFLGHILSGFLAFALILGNLIFSDKQFKIKLLIYLILGFGLCAFSWIPFFYYKSQLIAITIFDHDIQKTIIFFCICIFMFFVTKNKSPVLLIAALVFFGVNIYAYFMKNLFFQLPYFQYYRFIIYAFLFLILEYFNYFDKKIKLEKFNLKNILLFHTTLLIPLIYFSFQEFKFIKINQYLNFNYNNSLQIKDSNKYQRTIFVPNSNPKDDTLASYFQALPNNDFKSSSGIYWEPSLSNNLFSTYLTTLFKDKHNVIDFVSITPNSCESQMCFLDYFIRDYNIGSLVVDSNLNFSRLPQFQKMCFQQILFQKQTFQNIFTKTNSTIVNYENKNINRNLKLDIYKIQNKIQNPYFNNSVLEFIPNNTKVTYLNSKKHGFYLNYFQEINNICQYHASNEFKNKNSLFLLNTANNLNLNFNSNDFDFKQAKFEKIAINHFKIFIPSKKPTWFKIKLNWFPGFKLISKDGKQNQLISGLGFMLGNGNGEMELIFEKSNIYIFAYIISTISFILFILLFLLRKNNRLRKILYEFN